MRWLDRFVTRSLEREARLVSHPGSWDHVRGVLAALGVLVASYAAIFAGGGFQVLGQLGVALVAGWGVSSGLRRQGAYRNGWLAGRQQMVHALAEAQRRGLSPQDWLMSELERDSAVLGVRLDLELGDEDDER